MSKKIIMAGGGTGGHIFPAVAIANALKAKDPSIEILFVGALGKMEMEKVPKEGYRIEGLPIAGFNRSSLIKNIGLPWKLVRSFFKVRSIFKSFRPDAVIGVGGYSSFPVLRYAQSQGIPTFIHESNSFAGKSNMMLGKRATAVFVASTGMEKFFPGEKIRITGNPVRPQIAFPGSVSKAEAKAFFGLGSEKQTVLVMGGSLGARSINEAVKSGLDKLTGSGLQLIWQTGKTGAETMKKAAEGRKEVWVGEFISEMDKAYAAADLVVSRSGAMAIAELSIVKRPTVFVPFPFAAEDHQTVNAAHLVNLGAAKMVKDSEAGEKLVEMVLSLATDKAEQEKMIQNMAALGVTDADKKIAAEILSRIS